MHRDYRLYLDDILEAMNKFAYVTGIAGLTLNVTEELKMLFVI